MKALKSYETGLILTLLLVTVVGKPASVRNVQRNNHLIKNNRYLQDYPDGGLWPQRGNDMPNENPQGDFELNSIVMNGEGTRVAVGEGSRGRVSIYDFDQESNVWEKKTTFFQGGRFGKAVAMSADGNRLVLGKYDEDDFTGITKVLEFNSTRWNELGPDIRGDEAGVFSGFSVSMSEKGHRIVIGMPFSKPNMMLSSGVTRAYQWDAGSLIWRQIGRDFGGESSRDIEGVTVAMAKDGGSVAVATSFVNSTDAGHVRVYACSTILEWRQRGSDIDAPFDYSGNPLDIDLSRNGDQVIVGYPTSDNNKGEAVVYGLNSDLTEWEVLGNMLEGEAEDDQFGYSVSMSENGDAILIGVPGAAETGSSGVSFIYEYIQSSNVWEAVSVDTSTPSFRTAMSPDGQIVATMSRDATRVFKYELDTEFPSMAPTLSSPPSQSPTISFAPTEDPRQLSDTLRILIPSVSLLMITIVGVTIILPDNYFLWGIWEFITNRLSFLWWFWW